MSDVSPLDDCPETEQLSAGIANVQRSRQQVSAVTLPATSSSRRNDCLARLSGM
jgi:hypothetical protein